MYINPTSLGGGAPESPDLSYTSSESAFLQFKGLGFYGTNETDKVAIDDIRIGDSYKAVTPPDNPDNIPPVGYYVSSTTMGVSPLEVTFDASGSSDEDGNIVSYKWDFGDGSSIITETNNSTTHTFTSGGSYNVKLTVTDDYSTPATGSYTGTTIEITDPNQSPTASFTTNATTGKVPFEVILDASASSDADGEIALYQWDMGDGSPMVNGQTTSYVYNSAGEYTIELTVYDEFTASGTASTQITVDPNAAPVADFTYTSSAPFDVDFDAANSSDADGSIVSYEWNFNDGTTGSGQTISHSFDPGRIYRVTLTVTDENGATHSAYKDIEEPSHGITWDGSAGNDWFTISNWSPEVRVPNAGDNVVIPAASEYANAPVIDGTTTAEINNLTINNTGVLTVNPLASLTVQGDLNVENGGQLILETPENSGLTGSLITNGAVSGEIQSKRFIQASDWHYISSPAANVSSTIFTSDTPNAYWYNESKTWAEGWQKITNAITLQAGTGYALYNEYKTLDFTGTPHTGDQNITVTYHPVENNLNDGWNLIGNPFPSAIDWEKVNTENTENTIYFYNADLGGGTSSYSNYAYYNYGTFSDGAPYGLSLNGGIQYIQPHQGFFVRALPFAGNGANLTIPNDARVHCTNGIFLKKEKPLPENLLRLEINSAKGTDETVLRFLNNATDQYDPNFDAVKMFCEATPQVYTKNTEDDSLAINSLPLNRLMSETFISLGFTAPNAGEYIFNFTELYFHSAQNVFLKDMNLNNTINLRESSSYEFYAEEGKHPERFELIFNNEQVVSSKNLAADVYINIFATNQGIHINILSEKLVKGKIEIYNMLGKQLIQRKANSGLNLINFHPPAAVYIVKVITPEKTIVKQVFAGQ